MRGSSPSPENLSLRTEQESLPCNRGREGRTVPRTRMEDTDHIDVPLTEGSSERREVLRVRLGKGVLSLEVGNVQDPDGYHSSPGHAHLVLPSRAGPELLDTLYALLEDKAPSAIAAIDENHTWVADQSKERLSLEVHPGDILTWRASKWHTALHLPLGVLPGLAGALHRLVGEAEPT